MKAVGAGRLFACTAIRPLADAEREPEHRASGTLTVVSTATNRPDRVRVTRSGTRVLTTGLAAQTRIAGSEAANDRLLINTLAGNDDVHVATDVADLIRATVDLGADG